MKKIISIRLDEELFETLSEYANELNKTKTYLIEKALENYFDKLDEMVADKRIENLKTGKSSVVSMEDVLKKAGIDV